jgi:Post-transcriptional regulator
MEFYFCKFYSERLYLVKLHTKDKLFQEVPIMEYGHTYDQYRDQLFPVLESKLEEFRLLGNESISEQELWGYLIKKKWKKDNGEKLLHELVQDILSVKVSDFISYATQETYKESPFSMDNQEEWKELLK